MPDTSGGITGHSQKGPSGSSGFSLAFQDVVKSDRMANLEHLAILKQGVKVWNEWKRRVYEQEFGFIDLADIDLHEADLQGADFRVTNLSQAALNSTRLIGADFRGANLTRTQLRCANLIGARFGDDGIVPESKPVSMLVTPDHYKEGPDVSDAVFGLTTITNTDLRKWHGLDKVNHAYPSFLSIDTLLRSCWNIPLAFLRGCGLPDALIDYLPTLTQGAIQFYSCFISYSSKDQGFADLLHADLQRNGVRCWLATEDLKIGDRIRQRIDDAIRFHDKLLVVLSETSVHSTWVESEVETAFERERASQEEKLVLFPIRLDDAVMKTTKAWAGDIRRQRHIGDFSAWQNHDSYQRAFQRLLRDLKGEKVDEANAS